MRATRLTALVLLLAAASLTGCAHTRRARRGCPPPTAAPPAAGAAATSVTPTGDARRALYDGRTGTPATLPDFLARAREADLVAFGELHGHPVGADLERALLEALAADERPLALAMEFFERDTQDVLDAYLRGEIDEDTLCEQARQSRAYATSHGPLIDFCKARGLPVIAANAPRPLVTRYRKSGTDYATFRASLEAHERALLPTQTTTIDDAYRRRFYALMGERGPAFFRSQSLWDDAMAEAIADFRQAHPDHRVLLVVGAFHVTAGQGTITKYRLRRPQDAVATLVMTMDEAGLAFTEKDRGRGDLVVKVPVPPQAGRTR